MLQYLSFSFTFDFYIQMVSRVVASPGRRLAIANETEKGDTPSQRHRVDALMRYKKASTPATGALACAWQRLSRSVNNTAHPNSSFSLMFG